MKHFLRIVFIWLTVILVLFYIVACLTPFISPEQFVVMGFLGLAFPVLLVFLVLFTVVWVFVRRRIALILLVIVALGFYHILHLFGLHAHRFSYTRVPGTVRIMGWNVKGFDTQELYRDSFNSVRHRLFRYIQQQQPDIICIQDFLEYDNKGLPSNIHMLADSLGYRYYYTSDDYKEYPPWGPAYSGIAIFSKLPIQRTQRIAFTGKKNPESVITADITVNGKTRRLIVTHLQSMHLRKSKPAPDPWQVPDEDSVLNNDGSVISKLSYYLPYHAQQAVLVKKIISESPWPVIFSADMNEVPSSWCYHKIKGSLQDVFLMKGTGLGRTYAAISPTLRIDYLMVSPGTEVVQYTKDTVHLSDHYPQLMDIQW